MKLIPFTIVLDGEPFIERHLPIFQQLSIPWQWIVVEGASGNTADTAWCKSQEPRLSRDGTHEYLLAIDDKRVTHLYTEQWKNKTSMCNAAISQIADEASEVCLVEIDADEFWRVDQLETIVRVFDNKPELQVMEFYCRYFVGPDLMLEGDGCYGNRDFEWVRAWRFLPGDRWVSHEPPLLSQFGRDGNWMPKNETRKLGLVFYHYPYVNEAQVKYKEAFYGYKGLLAQWQRLQANDKWPAPLSRFFSHVAGDLPLVVKI